MTNEELLAEVEDVIRTMPTRDRQMFNSEDVLSWQGRAAAVMHMVSLPVGVAFGHAVSNLLQHMLNEKALRDIPRLLHQARHTLRMQTLGPVSSAMGAGSVFDYFDEVRKIIETASSEVFFVDPYLDAEFVSRYLPHIKAGVSVRLLARKSIDRLLPAVVAFVGQHKITVSIRASSDMHDRFVFIDGGTIYQSGASFKDGAKKAPTTLTQIVDAFAAVQKQYEDRWAMGTVHL